MELKEKEEQEQEISLKLKHTRNLFKKECTDERCLLILNLKAFGSYVKGKHSIVREFQSLTVGGKKLLT